MRRIALPILRFGRIPRMNLLRFAFSWLFVLFAFSEHRACATEPSPDTNAIWLAEHYTKYEHRILMRDGVRLFTRVYVPKDDSQPWPILLTRTPYALKPYGVRHADMPLTPAQVWRTIQGRPFRTDLAITD